MNEQAIHEPGMDAPAASTLAKTHGRTPDNTPIPGGGRWSWDNAAGAWVDCDANVPSAQPTLYQE